ncbi:dipeptidase D [Lachnospiraceae bacterium RM5]|nr:dipeptidase D [Lachnospiraceae bacterium RM5]
MSSVLKDVEPVVVLKYFEEISKIPRGSRNTKKISDYLVNFAKEKNLEFYQDDSNNVIIWKNASKGREDDESVILQGHMDMVCEKEEDYLIDFLNDGLELEFKDNIISAKGTTLGGDDGIALAYMLAILADDGEISHPALECVFTVDEEIGMLGAKALDKSKLSSKILLNLDSEDEGYLLVSCAGGVTSKFRLPVEREENFFAGSIGSGKVSADHDNNEKANGENISADSNWEILEISVTGLLGGHSGVEIDTGRGNANIILSRVLLEALKKIDLRLIKIDGGLKDNAIPRKSSALIVINKNNIDSFNSIVYDFKEIIKDEYWLTDPNVYIKVDEVNDICLDENKNACNKILFPMSLDSTKKVLSAIYLLPNGVIKKSFSIENLVQTSLNLGILETNDDEVILSYCIRSSVESEKKELRNRLYVMADLMDAKVEDEGDYPAWEYKNDSKLVSLMVKVFEKKYGREPVVQALHAGVECGMFIGANKEMEAVSFGPDIKDIHTTSESMDVLSVQRTWEYLLDILEEIH